MSYKFVSQLSRRIAQDLGRHLKIGLNGGGGRSRDSPVDLEMFLEADLEAETHLAAGTHDGLLLVGSLVHR